MMKYFCPDLEVVLIYNVCKPLADLTLYQLFKIYSATCMDGEVRLLVGEGDAYYQDDVMYSDYFYDKNGLVGGRIEICLGGRYGTICDDFWDKQDASVACRQLGFSPYGEYLIWPLFVIHIILHFQVRWLLLMVNLLRVRLRLC